MPVESLILQIDAEIHRLKQAKALLVGESRGFKKINVSRAKEAASAGPPAKRKKKRVLSPEARARIAEGQRKRWAAQRAKAK